MPCRVLRMGVFFDGMGNTKKLDFSKGKLTLVSMISIFILVGCDTSDKHLYQRTVYDKMIADKKAYVDFNHFKEGRPCAEVKFMCLPESQDKSWQSVPTSDHIEDFELTPEVKKKIKKIVKEWHKNYDAYHSKPHPKGEKEPMLITSLDKDFFDKRKERRFLEEMEKDLEKEFPSFWRDVPKKVRYRWIRRAMSKAKKFGYDPKQNNGMVELCARIGLNFDKDSKWDYITKFIAQKEVHLKVACDYLDWTIFNKTHSFSGTKITDWLMRRAHPGLPYPKKPYPKLND